MERKRAAPSGNYGATATLPPPSPADPLPRSLLPGRQPRQATPLKASEQSEDNRKWDEGRLVERMTAFREHYGLQSLLGVVARMIEFEKDGRVRGIRSRICSFIGKPVKS